MRRARHPGGRNRAFSRRGATGSGPAAQGTRISRICRVPIPRGREKETCRSENRSRGNGISFPFSRVPRPAIRNILPPGRSRGRRREKASAGESVARVTICSNRSCSRRGPFPRRAFRTRTLFKERIRTTSRKKAHFFPDASRRNISVPGSAIASGIPGYPAPDPKSRTLPGNGRKWSRRRESRICFTAISAGPVIAVSRIALFHLTISAAWNESFSSAPGGRERPASATSRDRSSGRGAPWYRSVFNHPPYSFARTFHVEHLPGPRSPSMCPAPYDATSIL